MGRELVFSACRKDFTIVCSRGTGPGGQKRNKTSTKVQITHKGSGLFEVCDETRSQHQNRAIAFRRLAQRLVTHYVGEDRKQRYAAGDQRVRTYHEPDDRVTDHRTGQQWSYGNTIGVRDLADVVDQSRAQLIEQEAGIV